ncbi:MAG: tetratricopeptide repeat protein, partial [Bacteroidota bacterium]
SCHFRNNEYMKALESFEYIISQKQNFFTEEALLKAARIHYQNNNYNKALENYQKLEDIANEKSVVMESRIYIMRCYAHLNNYEKTIEAVETLLNTDKVTKGVEREARFEKAMAFYHKEKWDEAIDAFDLIVHDVKSNEGAEAKFRIAEIYYKKGELKEAKKVILDFSDKNTPHQYWLAKSFILLADIYAQEENEFQAIHTLKSIIKNYDTQDDGIIDTAQRKKEQLVEQQENEEDL